MLAFKWNYNKGKYDNVEIDDECSCYDGDMKKIVKCCQCGGKLEFGNCYTSREIHTKMGFGYAVCGKCYEEEIGREKRHGSDIYVSK